MNIALLGLGVVGKGVYDLIKDNQYGLHIKYVLELDDQKCEGLEHLKAHSFEDILKDKEVDVIVELIGGKTVAYEFIKMALNHQKHVVTANKALMSDKFEELTTLAIKNDVALLFEASVGGGIIILDILKQMSQIDSIYKIEGILNGSTNYALSKVFKNDYSIGKALEETINLGYIEKGSDDDIKGLDTLRKINILSMIAYDTYLKESDVMLVSLDLITPYFLKFIKDQKLVLKYCATSEISKGIVSLHVEPVIFNHTHLYSNIDYEENIISIYGKYHHKQSFIGQGAGRYPTASAILYDLMKIKNNDFTQIKLNQKYTIDNQSIKSHFLIEKNGTIYPSELMSLDDILKDHDIVCFARIDESAYLVLNDERNQRL